ncbi:EF-HAND CALCIUM-BINDING DOMAIN CONTAINING PROTEIN [Salix purpurea]|uniref:EF-HAND CALCIUM-BINDING DOMAIN CONTAINING PROTEIN n=1 Tax=Salix purpurea TaxID=77065 RepID=A0A9Q0Q089_SALPP|nr:EF-HAND CALCIUM-BINDING DOMAIN CONTAINING PROTEIN [Salix purpurea]
MIGITGVCSRLAQALGVSGPSPSTCLQTAPTRKQAKGRQADELMIQALTAEEEKMTRLVLTYPGGVDDEEVPVDEVLNGLQEGSDRHQLLQEAFKIFDENGNGYIEAVELKRVLQCLGLDKGWGMEQIQKMLRAADLNFDGMVDFNEFELMMG